RYIDRVWNHRAVTDVQVAIFGLQVFIDMFFDSDCAADLRRRKACFVNMPAAGLLYDPPRHLLAFVQLFEVFSLQLLVISAALLEPSAQVFSDHHAYSNALRVKKGADEPPVAEHHQPEETARHIRITNGNVAVQHGSHSPNEVVTRIQ